ncbi:MAG: glycosyltransferase [Gallionella sp.]
MLSKPMVSVCITAYDHEQYLAEALDSVLSQKINFEIEVIIGEDYSTDSTLQIAQDYQARYSDLIRVVQSGYREKLVINGHVTARYNFLNVLGLAKGKYIAWLDGDDYWIDSLKLQKQVDFLEEHEEYSLTFHNVYLEDSETGAVRETKPTYHPSNFPGRNELEDLLLTHNIVPTSAALLRNNIPKVFPAIFYKVQIGDWPFQIFNLNFGRVKYMEEIMGVYRVGGGIWSKKNRAAQLLLIIDTYRYLAAITPPKLMASLKHACAIHYRELIRQYQGERKFLKAGKTLVHLWWYLLTGRVMTSHRK